MYLSLRFADEAHEAIGFVGPVTKRESVMATHTQENGRFKFDISYRRMRDDEGLSIRVRGPVASETRELLRFDCFLNAPHYHVEVYGRNEITAIEANDSAAWSLQTLQERFASLVDAAGADAMTAAEQAAMAQALDEVAATSKDLIAAEKSA